MGNPKYKRTDIQLVKEKISVYASPKLAENLKEISYDMDVYNGVKLFQILEAVYAQGKKDGARSVFDVVDAAKGQISHRGPGQPRKKKKQ